MAHKVRVQLRFNNLEEYTRAQRLIALTQLSTEEFTQLAVSKELAYLTEKLKAFHRQQQAEESDGLVQSQSTSEEVSSSKDVNPPIQSNQENSSDINP